MNNNLEALRDFMRSKGVEAVIIPGTDPHQSEYVSDYWKFRDWVSGFTGSNGTAVVTLNNASLWTDSRYFLQAEIELEGSGFELQQVEYRGELNFIMQWLAQELQEDDTLAVDGRLFTLREANQLEQMCGENGFLFATDFYPADKIWDNRPQRPMSQAFVHDESYAGEDVESKLTRTMEKVEEIGADSILITALDDIAWLLNLRAGDIDFTPVAIAFLYLSDKDRVVFIDSPKVTREVKDHLNQYKVRIKDYDDVYKFLEKRNVNNTILLDPDKVSDTLGQLLMCDKIYGTSPVEALKAVKNEVQINGFRHAMERDGAALVRLFMWIEQNAASGTINELDVWEQGKLERGKSELYRGDSFEMICGYREHGAIVHYSATPESASTLQGEGLLLVDSGAQYLDGTTDITRTVTLGNPTAQEKHDFTLVLKGHLALSRAKFPVGTTGVQLDAFARMPLWQEAMTYGHGTGHGMGHFLGCHEGPHSINGRLNPVALVPGMVASNEPGLYKTGEYGIRTENILLVVEGPKTENFGNFLEFETLTLFPYDTRLIDTSMLTPEEIKQVNDYHQMVLVRLLPYLNEQEAAWLQEKCKEI
ncbi:MAG: aminopeptidase P family protein [Muribaculaceae bacterium]|nr:aminopeptidase P family protein [Muribaculaceae bacterium]MBR0024481.1 aminopeptidase P family protein [Muribaculaceae bacterium]